MRVSRNGLKKGRRMVTFLESYHVMARAGISAQGQRHSFELVGDVRRQFLRLQM